MKFLLQNKNYYLVIILITLINLPYVINSTLEEVQEAIKEVAYSFYMRGKSVQFSDSKCNAFHPEDATPQQMHFLVCWTVAQSIYTELLNITVPLGDWKNFQYSIQYLGSPEVIAYSKKGENENPWYFYTPGAEGNITKVVDVTLKKNIIPILQIGDILSFTGHTFIIYDIIRDDNGDPTDAIIMETSISDYAITKLCKRVELT